MRIAVFSDLHGNADALKLLLKDIEKQCVDKVLFLGDVFFRGDAVRECIDLLREANVTCLTGNCELYFTEGTEIDADVAKDAAYYASMRQILPQEYYDWANTLPKELLLEDAGKTFYFAHFPMRDASLPYPYLPLSSLRSGLFEQVVAEAPYDLQVFGHAHSKLMNRHVVLLPAAGLSEPEYLLLETGSACSMTFRKP